MMSADNKTYLKRLSDYDIITATEYLIEPYVPIGALIFVCGLPKVFKSFLSGIDWGYSIATGSQWLGHPTRTGRVAYFALEAYTGVLRRAEAWRVFHKQPKTAGDNLAYITDRLSFAAKTCSVDQHLTALRTAGFRPDCVIIDTWFKATAGGDVGGQLDMSVALKNLRAFQTKLTEWKVKDGLPEVTFIIIAHTDKRGQALFGSITQFADCDVLYQLERAEHSNVATLTCIDARDIEAPPAITFEMEKVEIETAKGSEFNLVVAKEVVANERREPDESNAKKIVSIMAQYFPNGATFSELRAHSNMGKTAFSEALQAAKQKGWITGGGGKGQPYCLQPEASQNRSEIGSQDWFGWSPPRGGEPIRTNKSPNAEPITDQSEPTDQQGVAKMPTQPLRSESPTKLTKPKVPKVIPPTVPLAPEPGVDYAALDEFGEALEQMSGRPSRNYVR